MYRRVRLPAALVAIPLLAGCATGILLADGVTSELCFRMAAASLLTLIAALAFFADGRSNRCAAAIAAGFVLSGVSLGLAAASAAYNPSLLSWFTACDETCRDTPVLLEGLLREDASLSGAGVSLLLDARALIDAGHGVGRRMSGGVRLNIGGVAASDLVGRWRAGRVIRAPVLLRVPTSYGDPGVPDDVRGLARRGIVLLGTVKSGSLVDITKPGSFASEAAASARAWVRRRLVRCVGRWDPRSAGIAIAILIGDRSGLSDVDERRLQEAGTYHVIAISGGNVAILAALLLGLFRFLNVPGGPAAGATIVALLFYGHLASGGASVSRAVTGACVYLCGRMLDQRGPPLNALAVSAVLGLAVSPLAAFDGGFILSFGATLGILIGVPRLERLLRGDSNAPARRRERRSSAAVRLWRPARSAIVSLFLATLCAELALTPVSAWFFSRITIAGLALNFLAIPLMTIVQAGAMFILAAAPAPESVGNAAGYVTHLAASGLVRSAGLVDFARWTSQSVVTPPWWVIAAYYGFCSLLLRSRSWRLGAVGLAGTIALMLVPPPLARPIAPPAAGVLRVVFLDVGQGDSTLIEFPGRRFVLVDAGGLPGTGYDIGERVVTPALLALGASSIDTLVLTHGDPDHIGGAPAVLRHFSPHEVWEGIPVPPHPGLRDLAFTALGSGIGWRTVQAADRERLGGAEIRVLHPAIPDWERQRVRNEDSIVIELRFGAVSILLPGDIGREAEQRLTPHLEPAPLTIVKAPHHGSATSSTQPFLDALHPSAVVFSAGRGNRFGHPVPAVVARYRELNAVIFRTDEDGAIVLDTDGRTVEMWTWSGRRVTLR
ncbi:MAG: DNA internalization-related competence protein ComEC/Rec2 [Vicinamibacterales bacterium]